MTLTAAVKTAEYTVALAGNPNAGKTSIFNALTGTHQHVGNWPGKTVERKEGLYRRGEALVKVVDLPGTYSLTAYSEEERIARDFLVRERPQAVVAVVDACNLERNLYLVLQLLELDAQVVLALNMSDLAAARGLQIDTEALSASLGGIPVVATVAAQGEGIEALQEAVHRVATGQERKPAFRLNYSADLETEISHLQTLIQADPALREGYPTRWLAMKLLEREFDLHERIRATPGGARLLAEAEAALERLTQRHPEGVDLAIAEHRYKFIHEVVERVVDRSEVGRSPSDHVDALLTNPWIGIPLFLGVMYLVFGLVVDVSEPFLTWIDATLTGPVSGWVSALLVALHAPAWIHELASKGLIAGVGAVLAFIPVLATLYLFIGALEDSGYMARAAFVMDRMMSVIGLHGKAFVPMVLGFGCSVPAIYATRTLEHPRDRLLTALLVPLMSCSARLPVYVVITLAFFPGHARALIWSLYALGIVMAIFMGLVFSRLLFSGQSRPVFLIELPPYRLPSPRNLWLGTWMRIRAFLRQAGTMILGASLAVWLLTSLPWGVGRLEQSYFGRASAALAPVFEPAGFGTWEASGALVTGFVAKEMVISTMAQIYVGETLHGPSQHPPVNVAQDLQEIAVNLLQASAEAGRRLLEMLTPGIALFPAQAPATDSALLRALREAFTPSAALAFVVFVLLYVPCVATLAAMRHEFGTRWALFAAVYQTGLAWIVAVAVHHGARLVGLG